MKLSDWRNYKAECLSNGTRPKASIRQLVLFRLCEIYDPDLVVYHWGLISKILDK